MTGFGRHQSSFEFGLLPDELKRELCVNLLAEFGATVISESTKGELRHRCTVPLQGHTDRNSVTASLNYKKLTFHCFVCQNAGGILWWIAVNRGQTSEAARAWLAESSGISDVLDKDMFLRLLDSLFHPAHEARAPIPSYGDQTLAPWTYERWGMFHPYLTDPWRAGGAGGRECPEQTLRRMQIGYCDEDEFWDYHQRVILPLHWCDHLVGWQARRLWAGDPCPAKYLNSPDFPRDRTIYGFEQVTGRWAVAVESPVSVLRHLHHLPIVSTMGADITDVQIALLHRFDRLVWWLDNDKAGWDAYQGTRTSPGVFERLRPYVTQRVVVSPFAGADPADLREEEVAALVEAAVPFTLWERPDPASLVPYTRTERMVH